MFCKSVNDCEYGCGMKGHCGTVNDCETHNIFNDIMTGIFLLIAGGLTGLYLAVNQRWCCFKYQRPKELDDDKKEEDKYNYV